MSLKQRGAGQIKWTRPSALKNSPKLDPEVHWIEDAGGDAQKARAYIVAWQMVRSTVQGQVHSYNALLKGSRDRNGQRQMLMIKKTILGYLFELRGCFDRWTQLLRSGGLLSKDIKAHKRTFEKEWDALHPRLRECRNHAFHLGDFELAVRPTDLVAVYREIDSISFAEINAIWRSAVAAGKRMTEATQSLT